MNAHIDPSAKIGLDCQLGHNAIVMENVQLGDRITIDNNVVIYPGTVIGEGTAVGDNAVVGKQPRPGATSTIKISAALPPLEIGPSCIIGSCAVLFAGSRIGGHTLIGDQAFVRERCLIGEYVLIGRGVNVENQITIGDYTKIQSGAYITAYTSLEDHVFIAPCVVTTNDNFMGRTEERFKHRKGPHIKHGARVGANVVLLPGIVVGREAFVAAGSVVTRDVPDGKLVMGAPARVVRDVPPREYAKNQ